MRIPNGIFLAVVYAVSLTPVWAGEASEQSKSVYDFDLSFMLPAENPQVEELQELIDKNPGDPENYVRLGQYYSYRGADTAAISAFFRAVNLDPANQLNRFILYDAQDKLAEKYLKQAKNHDRISHPNSFMPKMRSFYIELAMDTVTEPKRKSELRVLLIKSLKDTNFIDEAKKEYNRLPEAVRLEHSLDSKFFDWGFEDLDKVLEENSSGR